MKTLNLVKGGEHVVVTAGGADEAYWREKGFRKAPEKSDEAAQKPAADSDVPSNAQ